MIKTKERSKEWTAWFYPKTKPVYAGLFLISAVDIQKEKLLEGKKLIVTLPRKCGNAVQRNRARRILRDWYRRKKIQTPLWIRIKKDLKLPKNPSLTSWKEDLEQVLVKTGW